MDGSGPKRSGSAKRPGKRPRTDSSGGKEAAAKRRTTVAPVVAALGAVPAVARGAAVPEPSATATLSAADTVVRDALAAPTGAAAATNAKARKKRQASSTAAARSLAIPRVAEAVGKLSRGAGVSRRDIADKKLRSELRHGDRLAASAALAAARAEILATETAGAIEVDGPLERTYKVKQSDVLAAVGSEAQRKALDLQLPSHGPYKVRYGRNGRHMLLCGRGGGHVAVFDALIGKIKGEFLTGEASYDACFLQSDEMVAVAQRKCTHIYDRTGAEVHVLHDHAEPRAMTYLPHHMILATVGTAGWLKYRDISTGSLVSQHRTKLGSCSVLAQNPHNAVVIAGHSSGLVTMWTPNMPQPVVKLLAHRGPVTAVAVDPTGSYMVTSGADARMRVWDLRGSSVASGAAVAAAAAGGGGVGSAAAAGRGAAAGLSAAFGLVHDYFTARPAGALDVSQRGMVACGFGPHVQVWDDALRTKASAPYMRHAVPGQEVVSVQFRPFEDVLGLGHSGGAQAVLVPGSGEPRTDTRAGLDPHESLKMRRDRDVRAALDKLAPDTIALNPDAVAGVDRAPADVLLEERRAREEAAESAGIRAKKGKSRGKSHSTRLRAKRQSNVITKARQLMEEATRKERSAGKGKAAPATGAALAREKAATDGAASRALRRFF